MQKHRQNNTDSFKAPQIIVYWINTVLLMSWFVNCHLWSSQPVTLTWWPLASGWPEEPNLYLTYDLVASLITVLQEHTTMHMSIRQKTCRIWMQWIECVCVCVWDSKYWEDKKWYMSGLQSEAADVHPRWSDANNISLFTGSLIHSK